MASRKYGYITARKVTRVITPSNDGVMHTIETDKEYVFPPDEPLLVIRGKDKLGPLMAFLYAMALDLIRQTGQDQVSQIIDDAMATGNDMEEWQKRHPTQVKWPD